LDLGSPVAHITSIRHTNITTSNATDVVLAIEYTQQDSNIIMAQMMPNPALNGQSRFGAIVIILSVFSVISTFAVAMRCYARLFMLRCFGRDDGVMVAAQILALASAVAIGLGTLCPPPGPLQVQH